MAPVRVATFRVRRPGHEVGPQEQAQDARVEEAQQPVGGLEEVERVARRRRVEHHQVEALVRASSSSFSIAMYSWLPASAAETCR